MIPLLFLIGLWLFAAYMTVGKYGVEALPILVLVLFFALIGSGGGD